LFRKDFDIGQLNGRIEDEQTTVSQLSRKTKELQGRIDDAESELEVERSARNKLERSRNDLVREMDSLSLQLEEAGGATAAQVGGLGLKLNVLFSINELLHKSITVFSLRAICLYHAF